MTKRQRLHAKTPEVLCQYIVQCWAIRQMALPPSPESPLALQMIIADRIHYLCFAFMWMFALLEYALEYTVFSVNMPTLFLRAVFLKFVGRRCLVEGLVSAPAHPLPPPKNVSTPGLKKWQDSQIHILP